MKTNNSYKLMGILPILLLSLILVSVIPSVSSGSEAINTFLNYEDALTATTKTVIQGDSFNLVLIAYGHGEALKYEKLELVSSTLIFQESVAGDHILDYTWLYSKSYTLNTGILLPGVYTLRFTARTATTQSEEYSELQLTILPKFVPPTPVCGNNLKETGEQCDNGFSNGQSCNPLYGSSCTYCSNSCNLVTVIGPRCGDTTCNAANGETCSTCSNDCGICPPPNPEPRCGDGICNNGETCSTCPGDCGVCPSTQVCGNGLKEGTEECDRSIFNGEPCNPLYAHGCTYCSSLCKLVTVIGPFCGDETCNTIDGETCSTCSQDCGICPPPTPVCDLTNAHWSVSSTLTGKVVSLIVQGSNCNGKTIDFAVYQDIAAGDVYVTNTATAVVSNGIASSNWVAVAPSEYNGDTTPRYYFTAKVLGGTESTTSGYLLVTIPPTPPKCGDGICNNGETCSTCPGDCGVCPPVIKPVVDITYPIATTYTSQITKLIFSVHYDNLKSCTYKLNTASPINVASLINGVNTVTGITSVTGINTWSVTCVDYSGNTGTDSVTFTVKCAEPPKNCTTCKDSKPLDDSGYDYLNYINSLNQKTTVITENMDATNLDSNQKEKYFFGNNLTFMLLIFVIGIAMLLIIIAIIRAVKERN